MNKFPFTYDLEQNLICPKEEFNFLLQHPTCGAGNLKSLLQYSLMPSTTYQFKNVVVDHICKWVREGKELNVASVEWQNIESTVERNVLTYINSTSLNINKLNELSSHIRLMVQFIGMQIFDVIIKKSIHPSINIFLFLKNLIFTSQGTINLKKTIMLILSKSYVKREQKFRLACYYFIEKDIIQYYNALFKKTKKYLDGKYLEVENDHFIYFWMWWIRNQSKVNPGTSLNIISHTKNPTQTSEMNSFMIENIFMEAIKNNNEIGVQYLWNNYILGLAEKERILERAILFALKFSTKINIMMFLLAHVNIYELEDFFKSSSFLVVQNIIKNVRWHSQFVKIYDTLKIYLNSDSYVKIFHLLIEYHCSNRDVRINIDTIRYYFNSLSECCKIFLVNYEDTDNKQFLKLFNNLFLKGRAGVVDILLPYCNYLEFKNFFCSNLGVNMLVNSIKNGNLDLVINILWKFFQVNDFYTIKCSLVCKNLYNLSDHFLLNLDFDILFKFINWCSDIIPRNDNINLKRLLLFINDGVIVKENLFNRKSNLTRDPFIYVNNILFWCYESVEYVNMFKSLFIFYSDNLDIINEEWSIQCYHQIRNLVLNSRWSHLAYLIQWKNCTLLERDALRFQLLHDAFFMSRIDLNANPNYLNSFYFFLKYHLALVDDNEIRLFSKSLERENKSLQKIT